MVILSSTKEKEKLFVTNYSQTFGIIHNQDRIHSTHEIPMWEWVLPMLVLEVSYSDFLPTIEKLDNLIRLSTFYGTKE